MSPGAGGQCKAPVPISTQRTRYFFPPVQYHLNPLCWVRLRLPVDAYLQPVWHDNG